MTSEFDGWAIGAYIKSPANRKPFDQSGNKISDPGNSNKVLIYGGAQDDTLSNAPSNINKLDFTYGFYAIGFHHEDMGDTFAAVSYMGYYNACKGPRCKNSYQ